MEYEKLLEEQQQRQQQQQANNSNKFIYNATVTINTN